VSEQAVDLRLALAPLRRHRWMLAGAAVLGVAAGLTFAVLRPPPFTSTSQVLLPPTASSSAANPTYDADTQVEIAQSAAVLGPAGAAVTAHLDASEVGRRVEVSAPTNGFIQIKATGPTAAEAEAVAKAVANADVDYLGQIAENQTSALLQGLKQQEDALTTSLADVRTQIGLTKDRLGTEVATTSQYRSDQTVLASLTSNEGTLSSQLFQVQNQVQAAEQTVGGGSSGARVVQQSSPATRAGLGQQRALWSVAGLVVGLALIALLLVLVAGRDRRLRSRDEIADALGSTVVASLQARKVRGLAGWGELIRTYDPGTVDAWALRQVLHRVVVGESVADRRATETVADMTGRHPATVLVMSLSEDAGGLALGPQLASYAATLGLDTRLVAGQRHESAAALWAACAQAEEGEPLRPGLVVDTEPFEDGAAELTVVVVVVDRRKPELADLPSAGMTILAVSSGSATAEDLAGAASAAYDRGSPIDGILIADPDPADRTTGRLSQHERSQRVTLPTRLTGGSGGVGSNVTGIRRSSR
jgi:capsular polysaccharide biosynthesis protein